MRYPCTELAAALAIVGFAWLPAWGQSAVDSGHEATVTGDHDAARQAATGHAHVKAFHGGQVTMSKSHHFETVFSDEGIRVYVHTADHTPLMVERAAGFVTLRFADGTKEDVPLVRESPSLGEGGIFFCPMHEEVVQQDAGVCPKCGGMKLYQQDRLFARFELANVAPGPVQVVVHVTGLAGEEKNATFTTTLTKATGAGAEEAKHEPRPAEGSAETGHP